MYEDVEAWVKSVYGGNKQIADENAPSEGNVTGISDSFIRKAETEHASRACLPLEHQDALQQQAAEDEAFLDAILQST